MSITNKKYLDFDGLSYFWGKLKTLIETNSFSIDCISEYINFLKSTTTGTTLDSINVGTRLHIITLSTSGSLSLAGGSQVSGGSVAPQGHDIHIIVKNGNTAGNIEVTMPTGGAYDILLCESKYKIPAGKYIEISVITDGSHAYYRVAEQN